jgi:hypothetical protein
MIELGLNCSCHSIQCKIISEIKAVVNCHCNLCRSLSGSAFNSYVVIDGDGLKYIQGEDKIATYSLPESPGKKHFCKNCGTPLYNTNPKYGPVKIVYLGSITPNSTLVPTKNIFCHYKLNWVENLFDRENLNEIIN